MKGQYRRLVYLLLILTLSAIGLLTAAGTASASSYYVNMLSPDMVAGQPYTFTFYIIDSSFNTITNAKNVSVTVSVNSSSLYDSSWRAISLTAAATEDSSSHNWYASMDAPVVATANNVTNCSGATVKFSYTIGYTTYGLTLPWAVYAGPPARVDASVSPSTIPYKGAANVSGSVHDQCGNLCGGIPVELYLLSQRNDAGTFSPASVVTNATGGFSATVTPDPVNVETQENLNASINTSGTIAYKNIEVTVEPPQGKMTLLAGGQSSVSLAAGQVSNSRPLSYGGKLTLEDGTPISGNAWHIDLLDSSGNSVSFNQGVSNGYVQEVCKYETGPDGSYGFDITGLPATPGTYTLEASAIVNGTLLVADAAITIHNLPVMTLLAGGQSSVSLAAGQVSNSHPLSYGGKLTLEDGTPVSNTSWSVNLYDASHNPVSFSQGVSLGGTQEVCKYETGPDGSYGFDITGLPATPGTYTLETSATVNGTIVKADTAITVTAPVQLTTPSGLSWDSTTPGKAEWNAVSNSSGYSVQLKKGGNNQGNAESVGVGTETYDFTSDIAAVGSGSYTFTVTAVGDWTNYCNSAESAASSVYNYTAPINKTLVSITTPSAITGIANGTAKTATAMGLPAEVTLVTDKGNVQADVNWDVSGSSYDPSNSAEQTFAVDGAVTLPSGVLNPNSVALTTGISVTVDAAAPTFVAVTGITGVPSTATAGTDLTLNGTVAPADATNQTIVWSVKDAGTTGASINGHTLSTTGAGTVTITATIADGASASTDYMRDFTIQVNAAPVIPTLTTMTLSGTIPNLTAGQAVYNLNNLSLNGTDQNGDPFSLIGQTIQWNLASGNSYASLSGSSLTPMAAGSGTVTASVYGVTSNPLGFTVLAVPSLATVLQSAATDNTGIQILLTFSKAMANSGNSAGTFNVSVNRNNQTLSESVTQVELGSNDTQLILSLSQPLLAGDTVSISYIPGTITSADGGILGGFSNRTVTNLAPQPLPISTGNTTVTVNSGQTNLAITPDTVRSAGNNPVSIIVPSGVSGTALNVAGLLQTPSSGTVTSSVLPPLNISAGVDLTSNGSPLVNVQVQIAQGTTVSAQQGWNGTIQVPTVQAVSSVTVPLTSGNTSTVDSVIEIGYGDVPLIFDHAVRILIPGQAGKKAGYVRNGTFHPINTVLSADNQNTADSTLAAGQDGYINVGADLVIWTKHFTKFVTYTETPVNNGGGHSNGGGGGSYTPPSTSATVTGSVINGTTGTKVADLTATATTEVNGKVTLSINTAQLSILKQPDGSAIPISDISEVAIIGASGTPVTISPDGAIQITDLARGTDNNFKITYDLGKGQKMKIGTMEIKIDSNGDVTFTATLIGVTRLAGLNRIDTALTIARTEFPAQVSNVILATSDNYPDALAGSVLACKVNAPILLIGNSAADQAKVLTYLKDNLDASGTIYILGGTGVVSTDVETQIKADGFKNITRLGGVDRYATSVQIAESEGVATGTPIVLVSGDNYPDALSISSVAAVNQYPVLLVSKDGISDAVKQEIAKINPGKVYIIGLEGVIGKAVEDQLAQNINIDKTNIVRIGGQDRFATSLAVDKYFNLQGNIACVATGNNFPDALAGSVYAASHKAPILLVNNSLTDDQIAYLKARKITGTVIFGGEAVVNKDIEGQLSQVLAQN